MNKETKIQSWIIASRPKTLLAALVPVMVGSAVAFNEKKLVIVYSVVALNMFCINSSWNQLCK